MRVVVSGIYEKCLYTTPKLYIDMKEISALFDDCYVRTTGAALLENNEASAKLTTANVGTFT